MVGSNTAWLATSSGTRKCTSCGGLLTDRSYIVNIGDTEVILHKYCLENLKGVIELVIK